jgi:hypothetical protein
MNSILGIFFERWPIRNLYCLWESGTYADVVKNSHLKCVFEENSTFSTSNRENRPLDRANSGLIAGILALRGSFFGSKRGFPLTLRLFGSYPPGKRESRVREWIFRSKIRIWNSYGNVAQISIWQGASLRCATSAGSERPSFVNEKNLEAHNCVSNVHADSTGPKQPSFGACQIVSIRRTI